MELLTIVHGDAKPSTGELLVGEDEAAVVPPEQLERGPSLVVEDPEVLERVGAEVISDDAAEPMVSLSEVDGLCSKVDADLTGNTQHRVVRRRWSSWASNPCGMCTRYSGSSRTNPGVVC